MTKLRKSDTQSPIITVKNLHKSFEIKQKSDKNQGFTSNLNSYFRPKYKTVEAVKDISFEVISGEILGFIGPNGAGKSTTIKMLTGILFPTSGDISVLGLNPQKDRQRLAFEIGSVFGQKPQLWYHLAPQDTYDLFSKIYELDQTAYKQRLDFLVDAFEIQTLLKTPVRKLSLGQRMRCEIVASLLHRPKIIFLDEPTIGLDITAKQTIREVIQYLNQTENTTIFLTSHDAGDIETLAKRTIIINHGTVIFDDETKKLKTQYIQSKVIELVTANNTESFNFENGKILEKEKYRLKIELNTQNSSIKDLLNYALSEFEVLDINISDPSLEEIIGHIYHK